MGTAALRSAGETIVDPGAAWSSGLGFGGLIQAWGHVLMPGRVADESFRVPRERRVQGVLPCSDDPRGLAVVDGRRGQHADARVVMRGIVPAKECLAEPPPVLEGTQAVRELLAGYFKV